jgi:hypothetical protein
MQRGISLDISHISQKYVGLVYISKEVLIFNATEKFEGTWKFCVPLR